MFHPHSQYYWSELLSKLVAIPFLVLLLLLIINQLIVLRQYEESHSPGQRQPDYIPSIRQ